jgi:hypothetical protein
MQDSWTVSRKAGLVWAVLMLAAVWMLPSGGGWTIDDSIKRIAAEKAPGIWAESLQDGPYRSALPDVDAFPALHAPFAVHGESGYAVGFAPWTRALFKIIRECGVWCWRLFPALAVIALWAVLDAGGMPWAFLLLPLTFYGLVAWEHGISWLLLWPAVAFALQESWAAARIRRWRWWAGILLGAACLLRPESGLLGLGLILYLAVSRRVHDALWLAGGAALGVAGFATVHALTSSHGAWVQIGLNLIGPREAGGIGAWLLKRPQAFYELLLCMDSNAYASVFLLALTGAGCWFLIRGERQNNTPSLRLGFGLLILCAALYQYRLWHSALPVLSMMGANSAIAALPWVVLSALPPYRKRPAFWLAAGCIAAAIVLTPVWEGVHWGPRILLFAWPLLVVDLHRSGRAKGIAFMGLVLLTLVQTVGSAALVYARNAEIAERVRLLESKLGNPVICPTMSQCADLAPLWDDREFFTAATPRELKQLLIELRFQQVDTVWLHLDAFDPLYVEAFPEGKPAWPYRMTVLRAGTFYKTPWRVYELVMNRKDSLWAGVLEAEAGQLMLAKKPEAALRLEREAVDVTPGSAQCHHNLALILAQLGQTEEARAEAQIALDLNSSLAEPKRLLDMLDGRTQSAP